MSKSCSGASKKELGGPSSLTLSGWSKINLGLSESSLETCTELFPHYSLSNAVSPHLEPPYDSKRIPAGPRPQHQHLLHAHARPRYRSLLQIGSRSVQFLKISLTPTMRGLSMRLCASAGRNQILSCGAISSKIWVRSWVTVRETDKTVRIYHLIGTSGDKWMYWQPNTSFFL